MIGTLIGLSALAASALGLGIRKLRRGAAANRLVEAERKKAWRGLRAHLADRFRQVGIPVQIGASSARLNDVGGLQIGDNEETTCDYCSIHECWITEIVAIEGGVAIRCRLGRVCPKCGNFTRWEDKDRGTGGTFLFLPNTSNIYDLIETLELKPGSHADEALVGRLRTNREFLERRLSSIARREWEAAETLGKLEGGPMRLALPAK